MRRLLTGLVATAALLGLATSAFVMGNCSWGHSKQVMASTVEEEAATMSTFDGEVVLPEDVSEADEAAVIDVPAEDENITDE